MNELFDMGQYGVYVWSSYALFGLMLVWDALAPRWRARRVLREIARRHRREAARRDAGGSVA